MVEMEYAAPKLTNFRTLLFAVGAFLNRQYFRRNFLLLLHPTVYIYFNPIQSAKIVHTGHMRNTAER